MKPVLKALLSLSLIAFFVIALGCGSPTGGGTSQITISISAASAKAAKAASIEELRHVIVFSGPTGSQTHTITGGGTVTATVVAGLWNISVTAYDGDEVYATGAASAEVKAGRTTNVTVQMTLVGAAATDDELPYQPLSNLVPDEIINNWTDLKNYIEGLETLITPTNLVIERTIMLYDQGLIGGIKADSTILTPLTSTLPAGAEIKVTLVTPTNQTTEISRDKSNPTTPFTDWMFSLNASSGSKVTLNLGHPDYPQNSNLVLDGAGSVSSSLINVYGSPSSTPILNMYRNVTLKNNNVSSGGAVTVGNNGTFNMLGGNITGNSAGSGGGVFVWGTFKMSGGTISNNTAGGEGGGVCVMYSASAFEMDSSAIISGNSADEGGGVYVDDGIFDMKGGEIKGNKALVRGGGVCAINGAFFDMSGGTVGPGNAVEAISAQGGGGVFIGNPSPFIMSGNSAIIGNSVKAPMYAAWGGGVYFDSTGSFYVYPGEGESAGIPKINGNTAESGSGPVRGGGVYLAQGDFEMNGGQINGNTVKGYSGSINGGGVYVGPSAGQFTKFAGEIDGHPIGTTIPSTGNKVIDVTTGNLIVSSPGHAVYVEKPPLFGRASTAGAGVELNSGIYPAPGWEF